MRQSLDWFRDMCLAISLQRGDGGKRVGKSSDESFAVTEFEPQIYADDLKGAKRLTSIFCWSQICVVCANLRLKSFEDLKPRVPAARAYLCLVRG